MTDWQTTLFALTRTPRALYAWRVALGGLLVVIGWLALTPTPPRAADLGWDKLNHVGAFAVLAAVAWFGQRATPARPLALLALLLYGGLIEIAQTFVPGRHGDWFDLLADGVGIAVGTLLGCSLTAAAERSLRSRRVRSPGTSGSG